MDYQGRGRRAMRVISNSSGKMTFKIPADGDKTTLVSLTEDQLSGLRDQIDHHLDGNHGEVDKAAIKAELAASLAKLPDNDTFADARGFIQDALDNLG